VLEFSVRVKNLNLILSKLESQKEKVSAHKNPALKAALTRAALLITNQAKLNIRGHGLIDTGRLLNSLRYEFYKPDPETIGVRIGSFGVPYAAAWEFGFNGSVMIRAHNRLMTQAFGKPLESAVLARVRAHRRLINIPKKSYLKPAYEANKNRITNLISGATA